MCTILHMHLVTCTLCKSTKEMSKAPPVEPGDTNSMLATPTQRHESHRRRPKQKHARRPFGSQDMLASQHASTIRATPMHLHMLHVIRHGLAGTCKHGAQAGTARGPQLWGCTWRGIRCPVCGLVPSGSHGPARKQRAHTPQVTQPMAVRMEGHPPPFVGAGAIWMQQTAALCWGRSSLDATDMHASKEHT